MRGNDLRGHDVYRHRPPYYSFQYRAGYILIVHAKGKATKSDESSFGWRVMCTW
jgi:hypothetical protein